MELYPVLQTNIGMVIAAVTLFQDTTHAVQVILGMVWSVFYTLCKPTVIQDTIIMGEDVWVLQPLFVQVTPISMETNAPT